MKMTIVNCYGKRICYRKCKNLKPRYDWNNFMLIINDYEVFSGHIARKLFHFGHWDNIEIIYQKVGYKSKRNHTQRTRSVVYVTK